MKKFIGFFLILCILLSNVIFAAPLPRISKFRFLPNGEVYHYYHFGDEWFDAYKYDGQYINSGGIVSNYLPHGVEDDSFIRYMVTVKGSDYITNQRFKIDQKDDSEYPKENMLAPFFLRLNGQIGDSVVDEENMTVTVKYQKGKPLSSEDMYFDYTDYGCAKYSVFNGGSTGRSGIVYNNGCLFSNKVSNLDEIYNDSSFRDKLYVSEEDEDVKKFDNLIDSITAEKIDFTKDTYMYLMVGGHSRYLIKYKIVSIQTDEPETVKKAYAIPAKAEFDKYPLYMANIIINILDTETEPQKVLINGKTIEKENNYAINTNYLIISKNYLDTYKKGEIVTFTLLFDNQDEIKIEIKIDNTTDAKYKKVFKDINTSEAYWEFIQSLYEKNIVMGDGTNFSPNDSITKAEFCVMLARTLGIEQKQGDNWYDWAIDGLAQYEILTDIENNKTVTYNQAAKTLIKVMYMKDVDKQSLFFKLNTYPRFDSDNQSEDISGYDANDISHDSFLYTIPIVSPLLSISDGVMTRRECAKAIYQFMKLSDWLNDEELVKSVD